MRLTAPDASSCKGLFDVRCFGGADRCAQLNLQGLLATCCGCRRGWAVNETPFPKILPEIFRSRRLDGRNGHLARTAVQVQRSQWQGWSPAWRPGPRLSSTGRAPVRAMTRMNTDALVTRTLLGECFPAVAGHRCVLLHLLPRSVRGKVGEEQRAACVLR